MKRNVSPREALASVPGWERRPAAIEPLAGGLNNRTYKVTAGSKRYVLRLAGAVDAGGARNFEFEYRVQAEAAKANLAPVIVHADTRTGVLLSEYLPGRVWQDGDLHRDDNLCAVAVLLQRLHGLPRCGERFPALQAAQHYHGALLDRDACIDTAAVCLDIVRNSPPVEDSVCSHNDLVAGNIVGDEQLKLIDWEYARDNDPLFDLASLIGWHDLEERCIDVLLHAYAGDRVGDMRERLAHQMRLFDAIQWLWLATRDAHDARLEIVRKRLDAR